MIALQITGTVQQGGQLVLQLPPDVPPGVHSFVLVMQNPLSDYDDAQLRDLYAEFAAENRMLAEAGMDEYAALLAGEDAT